MKIRKPEAGGPGKNNRLTHREPPWERLVINHPVKTGIQAVTQGTVRFPCCILKSKFFIPDRKKG